ncbi:hypothetical protein AMK59_132, partial [Oryctes borbonicus]
RVLGDKRSHNEPSLVGVADEQDHLGVEEHDFVPHFQRVSISGEDTSGVPLEDLEKASQLLITALKLRQTYMDISHQSFSNTTARFLSPENAQHNEIKHDDKQSIEAVVKNKETIQVNGPSSKEYATEQTTSDAVLDSILQNKPWKEHGIHPPSRGNPWEAPEV